MLRLQHVSQRGHHLDLSLHGLPNAGLTILLQTVYKQMPAFNRCQIRRCVFPLLFEANVLEFERNAVVSPLNFEDQLRVYPGRIVICYARPGNPPARL